MTAWLVLWIENLASWLYGFTHDFHLTTDPACNRYRRPKPGGRLERASRDRTCTPCLRHTAFYGPPSRWAEGDD